MNRLPDKIFGAVILLLSLEYISLPYNLSIFKVGILPLAILGTLILINKSISKNLGFKISILIFVLVGMVLTGLRTNSTDLILTAVGIVPFIFFITTYIYNYKWKGEYTVIISLYSLPHVIALILYYIGLYDSAFGGGTWTPRFNGAHEDPNFMAFYVLLSLSAKLALLQTKRGYVIQFILILGLLIDLSLIALSVSRGAIIALVILIAIYLLLKYGFAKSIAFIFFLSFLVVFIYPMLNTQSGVLLYWSRRIGAMGLSEEGVNNVRLQIWSDALDVIEQGTLFWGYSVNNFVEQTTHFPHNIFLDAFLDSGLLAGILFLILIVYSFIIIVRNYNLLIINNEIFILYFILTTFIILIFLSAFRAKLFWFYVCILISISSKIKLFKKI